MSWQVRHQGSPRSVGGLFLEEIVSGLRDGVWETTDEVKGPGETAWQPIENHPQLADLAAELEQPPPRHRDEGTSIDMNALIDVCLVLLIFFILTTTYAAAVQKVVPLPAIKADGKKARLVKLDEIKKRMIRLVVARDKAGVPLVRLENQNISVFSQDGSLDHDKLRDAIKPYVKGEDGKTEIIFDPGDLLWGEAIAIQDAAKSAGIRTIHYLQRKK
jgi:biopolymer transport protein ExbD